MQTLPSHGPLMSQLDIYQMLQERAYELWQEAGEPLSDGVVFWLKAEEELIYYTSDWSFWRKEEDRVAPNPVERSRITAPDGFYRVEKIK